MALTTTAQQADLTITFDPTPQIRSEAQLHQRVSSMGIDVYAKSTTPTTPCLVSKEAKFGQYPKVMSVRGWAGQLRRDGEARQVQKSERGCVCSQAYHLLKLLRDSNARNLPSITAKHAHVTRSESFIPKP